MKKLLIAIFIFTASFSFGQSLGVLSTDANVRSSPGGKKLKVISKGKQVQILQTKKGWSFIEDISNSKKGWVSSKYIVTNIISINKDANVRSSPGGKKLKIISKGKQVQVLQTKNGWSFIKDISNGKKGWVHNSVLTNNIKTTNNTKKKKKKKVIKKVINKVPNCDYVITSPGNGDKNVDMNPTIISWEHSTGSPKGYYFSIASKVDGKMTYVKNNENRSIKKLNIGYVNSYRISDLKANTKYFIGLVPYNDIGLGDCDGEFSFTTGNGVKKNTTKSSSDIIEKRLTKMGIKWKWDSFLRGKKNKIQIANINNFLNTVNSYTGTPYRMGGTNKNGIDCSGLIYRGLQSNGYKGERLNAQGLAQSGRLIANRESLRAGDLVCFTNTTGASKLVHHIAIYLGNNKFLHAPSSGKFVSKESLNNPYWSPKFIFGVRYN
ncbi:C40 family peptidase [Flavobacteriaceae bacterium]|nr:C40 family peptidase [Flavobacteriaceae bacterium]